MQERRTQIHKFLGLGLSCGPAEVVAVDHGKTWPRGQKSPSHRHKTPSYLPLKLLVIMLGWSSELELVTPVSALAALGWVTAW